MQNKEALYGLPNEVKFCKRCVISNQRPSSTIEFKSNIKEKKEVIDDTIINKSNVKKVVFCSGKFYYDLLEERENLNNESVALVRIEQLFPLHKEKIKEVVDSYPSDVEFVWAQEEPENMGAWPYMLQRFDVVPLTNASLRYYSVPAAGSSARFKKRHQEVINKVFQS